MKKLDLKTFNVSSRREVTVSQKYQIVIPKGVRNQLSLAPGMKLMVIPYQGRIELVPLEGMRRLWGAYPGLDTTIERESDRAL